MTGTREPHQMYTTSAVHFTDPFAPKADHHTTARADWDFTWRRDLAKSITPPPEMTRPSHNPGTAAYQQERGYQYGENMSGHATYTAPGASEPQYRSQVTCQPQSRHGLISRPGSSTTSPVRGPRPPVLEDVRATSRQDAQATAIAPSFQIPRALVADAKPNTGFRKWVTTILSTTLVAQNVVTLALLFIYRLKKLNPTVRGKPGSEYRLLTVALMLGNKFLDDNTYTNKTWADVSGIMVGEIHIMEVEFLSNMKYCLFTSSDEWSEWQSLLGRFADFLQRASKPPPRAPSAPGLPPMSSLYLPRALPSPPVSAQTSPYAFDAATRGPALGMTPAPSPLAPLPSMQLTQQPSLKRSHDDYIQSSEPAPKKFPSGLRNQASLAAYGNGAHSNGQVQQPSRLTLPSLAIAANDRSPVNGTQSAGLTQHLPPLNIPGRSMAMVYPNAQQLPGPVGFPSQPPSQTHSQYHSRQHSPYPGSAAASPGSAAPHSAVPQLSPSYFLQQRNSPYRPVHNVSRLLYPPPSGALQHRPQDVEQSQMQYHPLSKAQQRYTGRLPYVAQNVWLDGSQQQPSTPLHQLPSWMTARQQYVPPPR
ncbi:hypothetical protein LTR48_003531 [Friedmanniomyces endolithicus]|nr:hypothetical protein LTR48_003531 [Friedmanniomyces endolithicus]